MVRKSKGVPREANQKNPVLEVVGSDSNMSRGVENQPAKFFSDKSRQSNLARSILQKAHIPFEEYRAGVDIMLEEEWPLPMVMRAGEYVGLKGIKAFVDYYTDPVLFPELAARANS